MERVKKLAGKQPAPPEEDCLGDDLLRGAKAMGVFLDLTPRQVYHGIAIGAIPHTRDGRIIIGSKKALRARYQGRA